LEILDIVDDNGNPLGGTVTREYAHEYGIQHRTSHVWLYTSDDYGHIYLLLQKRSSDKDSFAGCLDISSAGHIPAGSGFRDSAVRELKEELGITVSENDLEYVGKLKLESDNIFHGRGFHDRQISAVYILRHSHDLGDISCQKSEVESVQWMDIDDVFAMIKSDHPANCVVEDEIYMIQKEIINKLPESEK
jgi:isopentenyldiphosphate isomerase